MIQHRIKCKVYKQGTMGNSKQDTTGGYNAGYYGRKQCRVKREDTKAGYKHETTGEYYAGLK